jgi:hypothetical protein
MGGESGQRSSPALLLLIFIPFPRHLDGWVIKAPIYMNQRGMHRGACYLEGGVPFDRWPGHGQLLLSMWVAAICPQTLSFNELILPGTRAVSGCTIMLPHRVAVVRELGCRRIPLFAQPGFWSRRGAPQPSGASGWRAAAWDKRGGGGVKDRQAVLSMLAVKTVVRVKDCLGAVERL